MPHQFVEKQLISHVVTPGPVLRGGGLLLRVPAGPQGTPQSPHPDQEPSLPPSAAGPGAHQGRHLLLHPGHQPRLPGRPLSSVQPHRLPQVAVNFLEMRLPAQGGSPGCESWVTLEETQGHLASLTGGWQHLSTHRIGTLKPFIRIMKLTFKMSLPFFTENYSLFLTPFTH